jgi:hypothetical protein
MVRQCIQGPLIIRTHTKILITACGLEEIHSVCWQERLGLRTWPLVCLHTEMSYRRLHAVSYDAVSICNTVISSALAIQVWNEQDQGLLWRTSLLFAFPPLDALAFSGPVGYEKLRAVCRTTHTGAQRSHKEYLLSAFCGLWSNNYYE